MKLFFIENRYKTYLLDEVAKSLSTSHDVYWIVQNHMFTPSNGKGIYKIPYPNESVIKNVKANHDINYNKIIESDRQINFFKKREVNYLYYYANQIGSYLLHEKPDFVFGEATAFHELLTSELCKKLGVQYLNPTTCRYPTGRFSFYNFDTLEPYKGSNKILEIEEALTLIDSVNKRSIKPDYMKNPSVSKKKSLKDKFKIIRSYYSGERYNTPSPFVKLKLERQKNDSIKKWFSFAKSSLDNSKTTILFPMHMQPESNIDVWGRPYRDQFKTVKRIHQSLEKNQVLYVKPNPKSKYELSNELIDYIKNNNNIEALRHDISMADVFGDVDLVVTITGTIAIECILTNKPVVTLINTINNKAKNCLYAENFSTLKECFQRFENGMFPQINKDEQIEFLNMLNRRSFKGIISDPFTNPICVSKENIRDIKEAFEIVLSPI